MRSTPSKNRRTNDSQGGNEIFVPDDRQALLVRNGVPERFYPPGGHISPLGPGSVEVRLLQTDRVQLGPQALAQPFMRSLLFVDGIPVGILIPSRSCTDAMGPIPTAWEGPLPHKEELEPQRPTVPSAWADAMEMDAAFLGDPLPAPK
jgi:hypothetical protein